VAVTARVNEIKFDTTTWKTDRRKSTPTRSTEQPTPQVDLDNIASRPTHALAEATVHKQTAPVNTPRTAAQRDKVNTAQHATPTQPTSQLQHSDMDDSPPLFYETEQPSTSQPQSATTPLSFNITTTHQNELYIISDSPPFRITVKDHTARTSTPISNWEPDDFFNFILQHRPLLSNATIQLFTVRYLYCTRPPMTVNQIYMFAKLLMAPPDNFTNTPDDYRTS